MKIASAFVARAIRSGERVARIDLRASLAQADQPLELIFEGVQKTAASLHLRISLSGGPAGPVVAGDLFTYGEGPAEDAPAPERFFPLRLILDITAAARQIATPGPTEVFLEILDGHGRELSDESLFIQQVELHTPDE